MGIVGVGSRGTDHVKEYLKLPGARIAALCDVDTAQMERISQIVYQQTQKRPKAYQDLRKLHEDKDIDAVSIATPNHWHSLAPVRPYNKNRFHYNWHWFWDTGNGDIGNQGIHEMDIARWGLNRTLPKRVVSTGGKFVYDDDQETPNTQIATFDYGDAELVFEVRGLNTGGEASIAAGGSNFVGNIFLGSKGYMSLDHQGFQIYLGDKREPGEGSKDAERGDTK